MPRDHDDGKLFPTPRFVEEKPEELQLQLKKRIQLLRLKTRVCGDVEYADSLQELKRVLEERLHQVIQLNGESSLYGASEDGMAADHDEILRPGGPANA